jgi:hypothetical protein
LNMSDAKEIMSAVAEGNGDSLLDWSSGDTPGINISTSDTREHSEVETYDSYLQSLEQPSQEASEEAGLSDGQAEQEALLENHNELLEEEPASDASNSEATEELTVTLENGRKAKILADYEDRSKIRKAYEMAAGMRKFQAERDQEIQRAKTLNEELSTLKSTWDSLEDAYQNGGVEGVIDLLEGREGASKEYIAKRLEQERLKESMSPDERARLELEERLELDRKAVSQKERIRQKEMEELRAKLEEADEKETRALITPAFERYRFKGKLGDEVAEHHFDQAVWMQALSNLEKLDDSEITADVIDREFERVSSAFARAAKQQASKATKQAVETKKRQAKTQAAVSAMKGVNTESKEKDLMSRLWKGDSTNVLKELLSNRRK